MHKDMEALQKALKQLKELKDKGYSLSRAIENVNHNIQMLEYNTRSVEPMEPKKSTNVYFTTRK